MTGRNQAFALCLLVIALLLAVIPPSSTPTRIAQAQSDLPTFVDLPSGATETYPGSGFYKANISEAISAAVDRQTQENWTKYGIAKESNLGLPLGSIYMRTQSGRYVELALYERAAFTIFKGQPARQILSTILFEGKIQVSETESVRLPENIRHTFSELAIAGEPAQYTPTLDNVARHLSTDPTKAEDANVTAADKLLLMDGTLQPLDPAEGVQTLPLSAPDPTTGHRTPEVMSSGLDKLFGEKVIENVGLPLSPALWMRTQVGGKYTVVAVQVFERMIVTYNPANDEANRVQVGLGGAIVNEGLANAIPPTPTTPPPTATPSPKVVFDVQSAYGRIQMENRSILTIISRNDDVLRRLFERIHDGAGMTKSHEIKYIFLPFGTDLFSHWTSNEQGKYSNGQVVHRFLNRTNVSGYTDRYWYATVPGPDGVSFMQINTVDVTA